MIFEVELSEGAVQGAFDRLAGLMEDMVPLTRFAEETLRKTTEGSLTAGVDPATGRPWAPLAASTQKRRARSGGRRTDSLRRSLNTGYSMDRAWIGSDLPQARTQQFGARRGAFGRLPNGRLLPWGDIPARPFLGLSAGITDTIATGILQRIVTIMTR